MEKKKLIIIIIIILTIFILGIFLGWFILFGRSDDVSAWIDVEFPAGSKYITKDKNIGGFPADGIDYFVIRIPSEKSNEFITSLDKNQWIAYDENDYNLFFNNWVGKILNNKVPLPGIEKGWFLFINESHEPKDISYVSRETLPNFIFAIYDQNSCTLHVIDWID